MGSFKFKNAHIPRVLEGCSVHSRGCEESPLQMKSDFIIHILEYTNTEITDFIFLNPSVLQSCFCHSTKLRVVFGEWAERCLIQILF